MSDENNHEPTWTDIGEQWTSLGDSLKRHYREVSDDTAPSEGEVREAFRTLGNAAQAVFDSVEVAMRDPQVRNQVKKASSSLLSALGGVITELGREIRSSDPGHDDTGPRSGTED